MFEFQLKKETKWLISRWISSQFENLCSAIIVQNFTHFLVMNFLNASGKLFPNYFQKLYFIIYSIGSIELNGHWKNKRKRL